MEPRKKFTKPRQQIIFSIFAISLVFAGCSGSSEILYPDDASERPVTIYVVGHGWHTAIVFEEEYIRGLVPGHQEFPSGRFIMAEWGDAAYFPHEDPGAGLLLRAALLPTSSVLHITGLAETPAAVFRNSTVIQIQVTEKGAGHLGDFVASQFRYHEENELIYAANGLYPNSAFFEAGRLYFFPRTSNKWTAQALRATGYPIRPAFAFTAGNVLRQSQKDGKKINFSPEISLSAALHE